MLFRNPGHDGGRIELQLTGRKANRSAVGARIRVRVTDENGRARDIWRTVGSGGSFGASSLRAIRRKKRWRKSRPVRIAHPSARRPARRS